MFAYFGPQLIAAVIFTVVFILPMAMQADED
jgi:poly-D-alanine transfer protein DltD